MLLDAGADKDTTDLWVREGHCCCCSVRLREICFRPCAYSANTRLRVCEALVECLPLQTRAQNGSTALIWAARYGRVDCARLLLDAGADMNVTDRVRGWSGLWARVLGFCLN
jgi:hypothetical protein